MGAHKLKPLCLCVCVRVNILTRACSVRRSITCGSSAVHQCLQCRNLDHRVVWVVMWNC